MKKLLALGATVLLSVFITIVNIDYENFTGMYCNEPDKETTKNWTPYDWQEDPIYPLSEWSPDSGDCEKGVCLLWRPVRYLDLVTCVQIKAVFGHKI